MTGRVSIARLRERKRYDVNAFGQLHSVALSEDELLALVEAVEAARATAPFLPQIHRDALNRYLCRFDFGNETT